jgi:hypothetical protein
MARQMCRRCSGTTLIAVPKYAGLRRNGWAYTPCPDCEGTGLYILPEERRPGRWESYTDENGSQAWRRV